MSAPVTERALREWLADYLVRVVGCDPDAVDGDAPVRDLGLGSTDAVVLSGELSELLARPVSAVELYEHPTINALAGALAGAPQMQLTEDRGTPADLAEPIAVIGIGCRFPGGIEGPQSYWDFLVSGDCAVGEVPEGRWDGFVDGGQAGADAARATTRWGAFLPDVTAFDAEYFGISPNEAQKMDPQQRLLLEVAHEAIENAGIAVDALAHSATGVYVGACSGEYGYLVGRDLSAVDGWSGTGAALSIISNRVSYELDLRGPSVTVDTACSSSLVTVHLAARSLRSHESDLAIAAGVNVMLSPAVTRSFDQLAAMSPTGRCHSFDAAADGYVRGEGCGVVILKRLSDAVRDGDRILAVVRGSAVNQDGRSNGLTAPNPAAQAAVLRAAYADARIVPKEVDFVETHGTGTLLGDPIEARALGTVLGRGRAAGSELLLGAVKSNLGHLESAAGVAGLIKTVLALDHQQIPGNVGFSTPNPHIPFDAHRLRVVAQTAPWPQTERPRRAGVSSFGFGGTNAHVVLEQAPASERSGSAPQQDDPRSASEQTPIHLSVPGKSAERVERFAAAVADWLAGPGATVPLSRTASALAVRGARGARCATVIASDHAEAIAGLRALAASTPAPAVVPLRPPAPRPGVVFVFSGQGSQWAAMGRRLLDREPGFARAVAELEPVFEQQVGFSLSEALRSPDPIVGIDRIQPVLVGLQLALVRLWRSYGVTPDAVIGHSMGEVAAAVVAGGLPTADGLRVIATRSRLMRRELSGRGAMAIVEMDESTANEVISGYDGLSVAVVASPRQTVIAGSPDQIDALIAEVGAQDRMARRVQVDVASHHRTVDPILDELRAELAGITARTPSIPVLSTVRPGDESPVFDADYWAENLRAPVRFADAVAAAGDRWGTVVEISPHPLLTHAIGETLAGTGHRILGTLERDGDSALDFHTALASVARSAEVVERSEHVDLPLSPWIHESYWVPARPAQTETTSAPRAGSLLGTHLTLAGSGAAHLWRAVLVPDARPYPGHHSINGVEIVPVSVLLDTFCRAAAEIGYAGVDRLELMRPVVIDQQRFIQLVLEDGVLTLCTGTSESGPFTRHASARVTVSAAPVPIGATAATADPVATTFDPAEWGVDGTAYPWTLHDPRSAEGLLTARIDAGGPAPESALPAAAILDGAIAAARLAAPHDTRLLVPCGARTVHLSPSATGTAAATATVRFDPDAAEPLSGGVDLDIADTEGECLAQIRGLRFAPIDSDDTTADAHPRDIVHTLQWEHWDPQPDAAPRTAAVIGDQRIDALLAAGGVDTGAPRLRAERVVFIARPEPGESDLDAATRYVAELTALVRELLDGNASGRLWVITRGVAEGSVGHAPAQAALWGAAGVVAAEHPDLWGGLVDLDAPTDSPADAEALLTALTGRSAAPLRIRGGQVTAQTPVLAGAGAGASRLHCRPEAAYLVTGGLGSLGLAIAGWLADRGARRLVLVGRTGLPRRDRWSGVTEPELRRRIDAVLDLERRGVTVDVVVLDVSEPAALAGLLAQRAECGAPEIRGVIHAAGIESATLLTDLDPETIRTVLAPKVAGTQQIDAAFPAGTVDFIHLVGSAGAVFGVPGQGAYAAANAYLDGFARRREHLGAIDTTSLDWVSWDAMGFGAHADVVRRELERFGSRPIRATEAFAAWDDASGRGLTQVLMMPVRSTGTEPEQAAAGTTGTAWTALSEQDALRGIEDGLRAIVAKELRLDPAELTADRPFAEIGLNSVMAMSIRRDAEALVGTELSVTMLWNHPTIGALARYLAERIGALTPQPEAAAEIGEDDGESLLDSLFDTAEGA